MLPVSSNSKSPSLSLMSGAAKSNPLINCDDISAAMVYLLPVSLPETSMLPSVFLLSLAPCAASSSQSGDSGRSESLPCIVM